MFFLQLLLVRLAAFAKYFVKFNGNQLIFSPVLNFDILNYMYVYFTKKYSSMCHPMNSKVSLLQVDEGLQSSGGLIAVLHTKPVEGRVVVSLSVALKTKMTK